MLLDKVRKTIEENALLKRGDTVICAVSGGADSICLLRAMLYLRKEYNLSLFVANVNHLIRGEESDRDSEFVKSVCRAAEIECFYREYNVTEIAKTRKIGEEECGRILRYEFFEELSQNLGGAKIATAHNLNDNAETVLFRLIRGSSSQGLGGIKYKRGNIIRPLLDVSRDEIEEYLYANSISWCEDSTNSQPIYARNKLRLNVMPVLDEISRGAAERIVSASKLVAEDGEYLNLVSKQAEKDCFSHGQLYFDVLINLPAPVKRRIAVDVLKEWGVHEITTDKVISFLAFLDKESGKRFDINADFYAEKTYNRVSIHKRCSKENFSEILDIGQRVSDGNWVLEASYSSFPVKREGNVVAVFDGGKLSPPLSVRYRRDGDRISPKGMNGTKKVSDVFSDEKIDRFSRDFIPIVEKDSQILYIGGVRQSSLYSPDENTRKFLIIRYIVYK